ncbi:hypothetical protein TcYC6_0019870 [Trypanosoma cruzi]|nr:hypothetical protein TcYC6_0019870 [Trypanosoma cruzi]
MEQRKYNLSFVYVARERLRGIGLSHRWLCHGLFSPRVYTTLSLGVFYRAVSVPTYPSLTSSTYTRQGPIRLIVEELLCGGIALNYAAANVSVFFLWPHGTYSVRQRRIKATPILVEAAVKSFPESSAAGALTLESGCEVEAARVRQHGFNALLTERGPHPLPSCAPNFAGNVHRGR